MTPRRTIAELAQDKAYLIDCLREVNAEIAARAGERDDETDTESPAPEPPKATKTTSEAAPKAQTATDKRAENAANTSE